MTSRVPKRRKVEESLDNSVFKVDERNKSHNDVSIIHRDIRPLSVEKKIETAVSSERAVSRPTTWGSRVDSKNASDVYASDMLQCQIGKLLTEVRPHFEKRMARVEHVLRSLKHIIENIPPRKALPIFVAEADLKAEFQIAVPWPNNIGPIRDLKYTVAYDKPEEINVIGSFAFKTAIKTEAPLMIDMAVTMPSSLFQEKDYLDYRYFHKRAYYIACIAGGLAQAHNCNFEIQYEYQNENALQPIILVSPISNKNEDDFLSSKCRIRILLAVDSVAFPVSKTLPWKTCVRSKDSNGNSILSIASPSPVYNATLRAECSTAAYLKLIHKAKAHASGFTDACVLGNVWLRQRSFGAGRLSGGIGGFEIACITALLLQGGGPNGRPLFSMAYSSYQTFKALLQFLASTDLISTPSFIGDGSSYGAVSFGTDTPVLFDAMRGHNVLFKMTQWSYKKLQHEVQTTLKLLNGSSFDWFEPTFIWKVSDPLYGFDILLRLSIEMSAKLFTSAENHIEALLACCTEAYTVLGTGFGDRVKLIYLQAHPMVAWNTKLSTPTFAETHEVTVGLLVNTEQVARVVDRGPSVEDKQAAASFRNFWGEKAELRRFKDGNILESLVWTETGQTRSIMQQIVLYVTGRHISPNVAITAQFIADDFDRMLPAGRASNPLSLFQPSMRAFENLSKHIRALEGLPLQIRQVSASCADLRYASIWSREENSAGAVRQPMDIIIQFEGSNRWPEDITSIQMTKMAFFLKLGDLLEVCIPGLTVRLGLENEDQKLLNSSFLDVIYPYATAFRLRIHHELELKYLERRLKDESLAPHEREEAASATASFKRTFIHSPTHTQAVSMLCTRFPVLSPSLRLMKLWISSHLLSAHTNEELIELLTIRTFVNPHPWAPPGSIRAALLRTLAFIAKWDWRSEPLIVDLGGFMKVEDIEAINTQFDAWRKIDPALNRVILFVASNLDPEGITWTQRSPSKVVAARLTHLAQAACRAVKDQDMNLDPEILFASSLADYDFVIHMSPKFQGQSKKKASSLFKNLHVEGAQHTTRIGYDPGELFVKELERIYGNNVVLFYSASSRNVVGGLWSPVTEVRPWKVNLGYSTVPSGGDLSGGEDAGPQVSVNKMAILHDIAKLGGEMIIKIDVRREI